ncbi:ATP-binding protein [Nesterenkonia sp. CL21]|uniref:sensor histidine kinase n=1 Tax=Nesterenkonia sp. CL21 TaxID=3064894 RepID=UPI00287871A2|nr:ATP-binding protein [Nesterenkonia sp. CL21]MDS2172228.1 ATP-binding protein [Nesterenkonia sp. CL21]
MSERTLARLSRWPLRRQLVAGIVMLLVVATVVIGVVTVAVQRHTVLDRVDDQLETVLEAQRSAVEDEAQEIPRMRARSVVVIEADGVEEVAELTDESGVVSPLSDAERHQLLDGAGREPYAETVQLSDHGSYRVTSAALGGGGQVVVGQSLSEVDQTIRDMTLSFTVVGLLGVTLAALGGRWIIRLGLRPLERLARTASQVSQTPLAEGTVSMPSRVQDQDTSPGTEVGQVGAALNRMLDHVEDAIGRRQSSEDQLRRFIADAGHELRTPLAAISAHAQLMERRRTEMPEELGHSSQRIRSESQRMGLLVEDLLLLARLDSGVPLAEEPVELARILVDVSADAQLTAPGHQWHIDLPEGAADLTVRGDAARLHQVVSNLVNNAKDHTPEGTSVILRLRADRADAVEVTVEDDGPGIPEELQPRIFDRFVRGDGARSRGDAETGQGNTGLGMAICAAIVHAHRGTIRCESRPGRTRFVIRLPAAPHSAGPAASARG